MAFVDGYYSHHDLLCAERVGNTVIPYCNSQKLLVCYQGIIYTLPEAYELNILNQDHVERILEIQLEKYPFLSEYLQELS